MKGEIERERTSVARSSECVSFRGKQHHLGCYKTEKEAIAVTDKTRKSLFAALYHYHTRPNTFMEPDLWTFTPGRVRVCRKEKEDEMEEDEEE